MKKIALLSLVAISILGVTSPAVYADSKPIQLSLWESVQIFPVETEIKGLRLAIYGRNTVMKGLDIGIAMRTDTEFVGLQYGILGFGDGNFTGWQNNAINIANGTVKALQTGLYNGAGEGTGLQFGAVNIAKSYHGLMLGIFNMTDDMNGLQIGIINVINNKEKWGILPIVNWQF